MNIADWIILFILLFAVAAAAVVFAILTIMNIANYAGNFTKERRKNVKARSIAKIITIFWPENAQH